MKKKKKRLARKPTRAQSRGRALQIRKFQKLRNRKIIIVGGADDECIEDLYVAAKSFNITPIYNHQYIYSAKTGDPKLKKNV